MKLNFNNYQKLSGLNSKTASEIGRRVGVEVTPHSLRHTFGKTLREKNVRLEDVARLMGHSNINITGQIYATPGDADLEKDVEMIGG